MYRNLIFKRALWGAILGLGAPVGYFIFTFLFQNSQGISLGSWAYILFEERTLTMCYMTFSTIIIFTFFGFLVGKYEKKLKMKNELIEEFLHIVAHDIKSPMAIVKSSVEMMKMESFGTLSEYQAKMADIALRQTGVVNDLITSLLDVQKFESGEYELERSQVNISELVKKCFDEMEFLINQKSASFSIEDHDCLPCDIYKGDDFRLRQVFRNLLSNAIKYIPNHDGKIKVVINGDKDFINIKFQNNGPHIPEEKLHHVFDKYTQSSYKDQELGHGLGMFLSKQIIDLHSGNIQVKNLGEGGVCFEVDLPRVM